MNIHQASCLLNGFQGSVSSDQSGGTSVPSLFLSMPALWRQVTITCMHDDCCVRLLLLIGYLLCSFFPRWLDPLFKVVFVIV
jgi:hypothetical protein